MYNSRNLLWALILLGVVATSPTKLFAQNNNDAFELFKQQINSEFNKAQQAHKKEFDSYRDSVNSLYSQHLKGVWDNTLVDKKVEAPKKPEPKPVVDNTPVTTSKPLPYAPPAVADEPKAEPVAQPAPLAPTVAQPKPDANTFSFSFYGELCVVHVPATKLRMYDVSQKQICEAWDTLSSGEFDQFLVDCQRYKEKLNLCDWGVYQFITLFATAYFGSPEQNESILFRVYALSQLGYKVRLANQESKLVSLVAVKQNIFSAQYAKIDGDKYYPLSPKPMKGSIRFCDFAFPNERSISLQVSKLPKLPYTPAGDRFVKSEAYPNVATKVNVNKNLIDFLDTYPSCRWDLYASASLSPTVKQQLYPALKEKISGATEKTAVNILLNFVQTAFEYKTDGEQFGREKIFFGDEPFFYPFCDCEDRSILFAILVRELLGLEVVLLDYPSHIATAVAFNEDVVGDHLNISGRKYVICDPTYIGASIGRSMPDMQNLKANVLKIN
ncbi:MAG: hypothetical protein IKU93_00340 [Alistipes sp.]|nr:hypothetical protein [Alistipes sp.]